MLVAGSYLTPHSHVRAYVTVEISASSRKFPSQGQKFLGESHRTGTSLSDTNSYLHCLIKDLGENIRSQNQSWGGGAGILSNLILTVQNQKLRFQTNYLINATGGNRLPSCSTFKPKRPNSELVQMQHIPFFTAGIHT